MLIQSVSLVLDFDLQASKLTEAEAEVLGSTEDVLSISFINTIMLLRCCCCVRGSLIQRRCESPPRAR